MLVMLAALLSGCGKDAPDDALASKVVRPYAEPGIPDVEVVDYQRDNGWKDPQNQDGYIVRYKYNLQLKKALFDVALETAISVREELKKESTDDSSSEIFSYVMTARAWKASQPENEFAARLAGLAARCPACITWVNQHDEDETQVRQALFFMAWEVLGQKGFKDTDGVGAKSPRTAWASFVKTEKGWQAAS
jgi:hypothetical protein